MAGALLHGNRRVPCEPAQGRGIQGAQAPSANNPTYLRVGTFNIHSGRGPDGAFDLSRTAENLKGLDVVGLNEVRGGWPWNSGSQAQVLGERLGSGWLFSPTERRWWRDDFGNGLLSRFPVQGWTRVPLPGSRRAPWRSTLVAQVPIRGMTLQVLVTHIDPRRDPAGAALREVTARFLALPTPAVLLGDLNVPAGDRRLQPLLQAPGVRDPLRDTRTSAPSSRVDWILTRGLTTRDAGTRDNGASDHHCVWAGVTLP